MNIRGLMASGLLAMAGTSAAMAAPPTYVHGILRCPDGSAGRTFVAAVRPTMRDLENACAFRASQRSMQTTPMFRHPQPTMSKEELRREEAKLIGTPR